MKKIQYILIVISLSFFFLNYILVAKSEPNQLIKILDPNANYHLIFYISYNNCTNCCIAATKIITDSLVKNQNFKSYLIIQINKENAFESKALRSSFKTDYFVIDTSNIIYDLLLPKALPFVILLDSNLNQLYSCNDYQRNQVSTEVINRILNSKKDSLSIYKSIAIKETDTSIITVINSTKINFDSNSIFFLDAKMNRIYEYSLINGELLRIIKPSKKLNYSLYTNEQDNKIWQSCETAGVDFVQYIDILSTCKNGSIDIFSKILAGYNITTDNKGEKNAILSYNNSIIHYDNDSIFTIQNINNGDYYITAPFLDFNDDILCNIQHKSAYTNSIVIDSLAILGLINKKNSCVSTLLNYKDISAFIHDSLISIDNIYDFITTDNMGNYYLISTDYKLFIKGNKKLIKHIKPEGILKRVFLSNNDSIEIQDMKHVFDNIIVLFKDNTIQSKFNQLIMQTYSDNGQFPNEVKIVTPNEELIESSIVGYVNNELVFLNKWKNRRWTLDYVKYK
jgi:hypothetical protein